MIGLFVVRFWFYTSVCEFSHYAFYTESLYLHLDPENIRSGAREAKGKSTVDVRALWKPSASFALTTLVCKTISREKDKSYFCHSHLSFSFC